MHPIDIPVAPVKGARVVFKGCLAGEAVAPPKKKAAKKKAAHKPYPCGPDHGHFGRKLSPEHRAKVAAANAARWAAMTPEQRRARNARQIAVLHSAEVKANAAAAIRARYATPELREQHAALIRAALPRKVNAPTPAGPTRKGAAGSDSRPDVRSGVGAPE